MAPMENGSFMVAFGEWEVIAACVFLMLLFPLIFFIASGRRWPRPATPVRKRPLRAAAAAKTAAKAKSLEKKTVSDEGRDSRE
jgi:hypothetical protein